MGLSRFGIVAVFLALASFVGDGVGEFSGLALVGRALAAWGLLIPLRLRDDLASLPYDREHHPERVLVQAPELGLFWGAWSGIPLIALAGFMQFRGIEHAGLWFLLVAIFEFFYRWQGAGLDEGHWSHLWVLSKYPILVLLLQAQPLGLVSLDFALACCLVYLTFCIFELLDAGGLSRVSWAPAVLWAECTLAGLLCAFLLSRQLNEGAMVAWLAVVPWWGLALMSVRLVHADGRSLKVAPVSFGLAFVGLAWIVVNS